MRSLFSGVILVLLLAGSGIAHDPTDLQGITKIKSEGFNRSEVMETLSYLTDVHGSRLTGSPGLKAASEWARDQLTEWGLSNARLEAWGTFGKGWSTEQYMIEMTEPHYMHILAHPKAWTPGTDGEVSGTPILLDVDDDKLVEEMKGKLGGAIVLLGKAEGIAGDFEADERRYTEEELLELAAAPEPGVRRSRRNFSEERRRRFARRGKMRKLRKFLADEGVAVSIEASSLGYGTLRVTSGGTFRSNSEPTIPQIVVAGEHYNRMVRLIEKDIAVKLRLNIKNTFHTEDSLGYNVFAELPGYDKKLKKEIVMLGAHLDSWHAGTGATDNGSGSAVMMEAIRILKMSGVKPRRTIRVALWTGEEQGLLGSRGFVKKHVGEAGGRVTKDEYDLISAYYNMDNGTGKVRGIYLQGNDALRPIFEAFFEPFHDLGATTVTMRNTGGTDHLPFDAIGVPGFQFIQDPIAYFSRTWHTNLDVLDHVQKSDLMQASVIIAAIVYQTAMLDEKLPRKPLSPREN